MARRRPPAAARRGPTRPAKFSNSNIIIERCGIRTSTDGVNSQCKFVAAENCAKRNRVEFGGNCHENRRLILPASATCTAIPSATKIFALCDQSVAAGIPPAHDALNKFNPRPLQLASVVWRCVLVFRHVNEGVTCLGPDLEAECRRRVRGVCIRRRDFAGGILSSGVRRQRDQKSRHEPVKSYNTGEANRPPVFCLYAREATATRYASLGTDLDPKSLKVGLTLDQFTDALKGHAKGATEIVGLFKHP